MWSRLMINDNADPIWIWGMIQTDHPAEGFGQESRWLRMA